MLGPNCTVMDQVFCLEMSLMCPALGSPNQRVLFSSDLSED